MSNASIGAKLSLIRPYESMVLSQKGNKTDSMKNDSFKVPEAGKTDSKEFKATNKLRLKISSGSVQEAFNSDSKETIHESF